LLTRLPWGTLAAALPSLILLGVMLHYYWDFVSDDAFISFRYAEHLATGQGLEWNPGYRVEGYSNFLWVVLMALLRLLGMSVPAGARLLSLLAAGVTVVLVVATARRAVSRPSWILLILAPMPLCLSFPFQMWSSMRLETPLFAMLLLLSTLLFVREEESLDKARWPSALAYLALALVRPEGAAFIAVPGIFLLARIRSRAQLWQSLKERRAWLAVFFGGVLAYHLWRVLYFGDIYPNTYYAKVGGENILELGWSYLERFIIARPYHLVLLTAVLLLGGSASRAGVLLVGKVLTLTALVVLEGGDWMREWRLLIPMTPLLVAALAAALQCFAAQRSAPTRVTAAVGVVILCLGIQQSMGTPLEECKQAARGQRRDLLINLEGEMTRVSKEVGQWLRRNSKPGDLIAVNHSGAVPFYSGLPTIDMVGLNDLHIARIPGVRHSKWDPDYVFKRRPAFLVLNTRSPPHHGQYIPGYWRGETVLVEHPDFKRFYKPVQKFWSWRHRDLNARLHRGFHTAYIMIFRRDQSRYASVGRCLGFESGTYQGWEVRGEAFGKEPAKGARKPQRLHGFLGRYLANSFPGTDRPAGLLRSQPFTIQGNRMEFLIGGGADPQKAGARLKVDGRTVLQSHGRNDDRLRLQVWELSALEGKTAVVEIYDRGGGSWGHVLADDFCQFRVSAEKSAKQK